jgi:hypothetical protein
MVVSDCGIYPSAVYQWIGTLIQALLTNIGQGVKCCVDKLESVHLPEWARPRKKKFLQRRQQELRRRRERGADRMFSDPEGLRRKSPALRRLHLLQGPSADDGERG